MKKVIALMLIALLWGGVCMADNSARIGELQKEKQMLLREENKRQNEIGNIRIRVCMINGAIEELTTQDKASKVEETKEK